jgi:hypothetical protein
MASLLRFLYKRRRNEDGDAREDQHPAKRQVYAHVTCWQNQNLS